MATHHLAVVSSGRGKGRGGPNPIQAQHDPDLKLFVRNVLENKKRPLPVRSWSTIKDVKDQLSQKLQVPASSIRLYFGPLLTSGKELPNHRTLHDVGIYRSGETILLDIKNNNGPSHHHTTFPTNASLSPLHANRSILESSNASSADVQISSSVLPLTPKYLQSLVSQARWGLMYGLKPDLVLEGSGGTYILHDVRKNPIAIFKPSDEEPYAENNPRGYLRPLSSSLAAAADDTPLALRAGVAPGEACIREVAAYLLDTGGFAGVPPTTLVEARHSTFNTNGSRLNVSQGGASIGPHSIGTTAPSPQARSPVPATPQHQTGTLVKKPGSFQEYVKCECTIDDISPSKIATVEVHKIAILDIRIMNADRNAANLLVRRRRDNTLELVPIDHGFCLRSVCDVSWMDWCWLDWPQLKEPLCSEHKDYIMSLDVEADARLLREHLNICEEAVDYFRASSALLKAGVAAGLTLYDIAIMCCRNDNLAEIPSMMEKLYDMASDLAHTAVKNERWHHSATSRAIEEQLLPSPAPTISWATAPMIMMPPAPARQRKFGRSVSNAEFTSSSSSSLLAKAMSDHSIIKEETAPSSEDDPGMAHSSVSDSCSEAEEVTEVIDACNQWAAELIAKVESRQNLQASASPVRPPRSSSVGSCDNSSSASVLSTSPTGFWTVRPGSTERMALEDNESIQWSPRSVSRVSLSGLDLNDDPPFMLDDCYETPTVQRVTFSPNMMDSPHFAFIPPASVDVIKIADGPDIPTTTTTTTTNAVSTTLSPEQHVLLVPSGKAIHKSKSYSAMPMAAGRPRSNGVAPPRGPVDKSTEHYAQYKKYFHKFIDLVIVRETTTAAFHFHQSKNNNTSKLRKKHASR